MNSSANFCRAIFLAGLACCAGSLLAQEKAPLTAVPPSEGDYVVKDFKFNSGESLPEIKLHYTTEYGKPRR